MANLRIQELKRPGRPSYPSAETWKSAAFIARFNLLTNLSGLELRLNSVRENIRSPVHAKRRTAREEFDYCKTAFEVMGINIPDPIKNADEFALFCRLFQEGRIHGFPKKKPGVSIVPLVSGPKYAEKVEKKQLERLNGDAKQISPEELDLIKNKSWVEAFFEIGRAFIRLIESKTRTLGEGQSKAV